MNASFGVVYSSRSLMATGAFHYDRILRKGKRNRRAPDPGTDCRRGRAIIAPACTRPPAPVAHAAAAGWVPEMREQDLIRQAD